MGCKHGIVAKSYKNTVNQNNAHKDHNTDTVTTDHFSINVFLSKSDNCAVSRLSAAAGPRGKNVHYTCIDRVPVGNAKKQSMCTRYCTGTCTPTR